MKRRLSRAPLAAVLTALFCAAPFAHGASDGAAPQPMRTTISLHAGGKEVAGLVLLPGQGRRGMQASALNHETGADGSLHMSGNVRLSLTMENAVPITLYGDDLTIRSEALDADQVHALDDLKQMGVSDQAVRADVLNMTSADAARLNEVDHANMKRLAEIIGRYGWPGTRFAGAYADNAFMVLQHADLDSQRTYLPLLRAAAVHGDASAADVAMLEDRILMKDGKPQVYGTQFESIKPMKQYVVADPAHLDERRRAVGLGPMSDYVAMLRQMYHVD